MLNRTESLGAALLRDDPASAKARSMTSIRAILRGLPPTATAEPVLSK
jgi:hypothetical protein